MAGKYVVQVCNLSTKASEHHVKDFFSYCGTVLNVRLERAGKYAKVAFVTFKEPYALETAVLLSGSRIKDQEVCVVPWGGSEEAVMNWKRQSMSINTEDQGSKLALVGRAVTMAQDVVTTVISKGYTVSKDALIKAKELDEKYHVTANAAAKVASLGKDVWTKTKELEEKYHIRESAAAKVTSLGQRNTDGTSLISVDNVKSALSSAGSTVVNNPYFCEGAIWVSEFLGKASKATSAWTTKGNPVSQ